MFDDSAGQGKGGGNLTTTALTSLLAAPGTNQQLTVTWLKAVNADVTTNCKVELFDGASATGIKIVCQADGGGEAHRFDPPLFLSPGNALQVQASAAADVEVAAIASKFIG